MPGIRFDDSAAAYVVLAAMALFFAVANGFILYRHLTWASRVRRLLEQEGFTVRQMERRWLTKGPFSDLRRPGTRHHKEWLVRVAAVDREHRPRAGWVRWRRKWPWEAADTWAVQWDEGPLSGLWGDAPAARKRGLSTTVFMALVLPPALVGMVLGVNFLVRNFQWQQPRTALAPQQTAGAAAPTSGVSTPAVYEIRCRGSGRDAFRIEQLSAGKEPGKEVPAVLMSLHFIPSAAAAGVDGAGLTPGSCSWLDRPLNSLEPRVIRFEVRGITTTDRPDTILPEPGSFPDEEYFSDAERYWSFNVFNFNAGFLQTTSHTRWIPPSGPGRASGAER